MAENKISPEFKDLLVYLAENMIDRDIINIKFRYDGILSKIHLEKKDNIELLYALKDNGIIGIDKIDELENIVKICTDKNERLLRRITGFKQSVVSSSNTTSSTLEKNENIPTLVNPFRDLLIQVGENMTEYDFKKMKRQFSDHTTVNRMESIKYPIEIFEIMFSKNIIINSDQLKEFVKKYTNNKSELLKMISKYEQEIKITQVSSKITSPVQDLQEKLSQVNVTENVPQSSATTRADNVEEKFTNNNSMDSVAQSSSVTTDTGNVEEKFTKENFPENSPQSSSVNTDTGNVQVKFTKENFPENSPQSSSVNTDTGNVQVKFTKENFPENSPQSSSVNTDTGNVQVKFTKENFPENSPQSSSVNTHTGM